MFRLAAPYEIYYATARSAGTDIRVTKDYAIDPGEVTLLSTGVTIAQVPELADPKMIQYLQLTLRSSFGGDLIQVNAPGIIDEDYPGEIMVKVRNLSDKVVLLDKGERIAQLIYVVSYRLTDVPVSDKVRDGGLGSTNE